MVLVWVGLLACRRDDGIGPGSLTSNWALDDPERACLGCHPIHVTEWAQSMHAYAAIDPLLAATAPLAHASGVDPVAACESCHAPLAAPFGGVLFDGEGVAQAAALPTPLGRGVTCEACHMTKHAGVENGDADRVYDGVMSGGIDDPVSTDAHGSAFSDLLTGSVVCVDCHRQTLPDGTVVQDTPAEAVAAGAAPCQTCHMEPYEGPAALGGPQRTVHHHYLTGVGVPLLDEAEFPGFVESFDRSAYLLANGVQMSATVDPEADRITVNVTNLAGHDLPSGTSSERRLWLEVVVQDEARVVAFESGTLDENGDLRVADPSRTTRPNSDPALAVWGHDLVDAGGVAVRFPWEASDRTGNVVGSGQTATVSYDLSALPTSHYYATVRLNFRALPNWLLTSLEAEGGLEFGIHERNPFVVAASAELEFSLEGPRPEEEPPSCEEGDIPDCVGACWPELWVGDFVCDDGSVQVWGEPDFDCELFAFDGGDCVVAPCVVGEVLDCVGLCWPEVWVGDGWCDDGTMEAWGDPNFDCVDFSSDAGDCDLATTGVCPGGEVADCVGVCWPDTWVGDGWCDDGSSWPWGDPDYACELHVWDAGDCPDEGVPVGDCDIPGWVQDCAGVCWPEEWVGDGFCDDGTLWPWGDPDFACAEFGVDGGDC